jgi:hypothetical protein
MNNSLRLITKSRLLFAYAATFCSAVASAQGPPTPPMTNGGDAANNGMKHVNVSLADGVLGVHVDSPPLAPVVMRSGLGMNYEPAKFDVLEGVYFNAQHGWLPTGFFGELPAGASIWIRRTAATQPAGSTFKVYEAGNMMEGMASWTMNEIYASDGAMWHWDGLMQHDYFAADLPGDYSMSFEVYVGDPAGDPLPDFSSAAATLEFVVVPEPSGVLLAAAGCGCLLLRRRKREFVGSIE